MRDVEIIGLMDDYNKFKKYYKAHLEENIKEHFVLHMNVKALMDILSWVPFLKWAVQYRYKKITAGIDQVK